MTNPPKRPRTAAAVALTLAATAMMAGSAHAQINASQGASAQKAAATVDPDARMRKMEAEIKALQRQVFPGGDGKFFPPEIEKTATTATPSGTPATTPVTDLLTRMDSVEAQLSRLTALSEENGNRIAQLEAKLTALTPPPAPVATAPAADPATPATGASATPAAPSLAEPQAATPAPAPRPAITSANLAPAPTTPTPAPASAAAAKPAPAAAKPAPATMAAKPAPPSAQRVAAVKAIEKPATTDAGDDEYSYGYRLWEAKFYPEAEQQLQLFVTKYPKHARISYGRNLLGRAYLDDSKPREAAQWFFTNYQADGKGARAADSLLGLAEAVRQLKQTDRACVALGEFADLFKAEAAGRLKSQYDATRSKVKCN